MRRFCLLLVLVAAVQGLYARTATADSLDRAVAVFFASQFKMAFANGLGDIRSTRLEVDSAKVMQLIAQEMTLPYDPAAQDRAFAIIDAAANAVIIEESALLLANAAKAPGALLLPSGVVVETVSAGNGPELTRNDRVKMRYTGKLPDGTVFDSMSDDDEPIDSPVSQFVAGMTEGLTHMQRGGRYILTLPAAAAYGEHGVQGVIPPNCALQFDITLY